MKRRIHQNVWGNWNGYAGSRRVEDFGTDEMNARYWLQHGARTDDDFRKLSEDESLCRWKLVVEQARRAGSQQVSPALTLLEY